MHPVDSKDIAFQIAGREAFRRAFEKAGPVLLEPIAVVKVTVPDEYVGDIIGDLNTKRAIVLGMGQERGKKCDRGEGAAGRDATLCGRASLPHPGARHLHHGAVALRGSAQQHRPRHHRSSPQEREEEK